MWELKKVKIFDEMSEETICFTAQFFVDNKHIANVRNDGQGGCNDLYPTKGYTYDDIKEFDTLDMEVEIMGKAIEIDEVRKYQSKGFYLKKGENYFKQPFPMSISKLKKHPQYNAFLLKKMSIFKKDGYEVLNKNL